MPVQAAVRSKYKNRPDYKLNRFKFDGRLYSQMAYTKTKYLNTFFKVEKKTHNTDIALKTRGHFMTNMMDDIAHLSQEIGPRPAGTEEEQQAALYIADELQKSAGFSTIVEDVSCASNGNTVRAICLGSRLSVRSCPSSFLFFRSLVSSSGFLPLLFLPVKCSASPSFRVFCVAA